MTESQTSQSEQKRTIGEEMSRPVVFFDGVCGLCNHFIDFVLTRDQQGLFQFAPLQGETAAEQLDLPDEGALDSVILLDGRKSYQKSSAVVRILWKLGAGWKLVGTLLWLIPLPLRNLGYTLVAKMRYRLFGKQETCRLPSPDERSRFLE